MNTQTKLPIIEPSGAFVGEFSMRTHKKGDIKWHRDGEGRVVVDIESMKAAMGKPLAEHPKQRNRVVSGSGGYGRNLVMRQFSDDSTYPLTITQGKIGTGTNTPADGDTDLQTAVLSNIDVQLFELANDVLVVSFFIPDGDLTNGTYNEFGMFCGDQLLCRAIINPAFSKSTNEDTTVEYTLTLSQA
jgi:hypothetical protein